MPNESINFEDCFEKLTGNKPLSWQRRLYNQWIEDDVKPIIDLPTGLGKTMVIPIWLIAQATNRKLGRRLIYVVDRRTVVDQATQLAEQLAMRPCIRFIYDSLGNPPAISTLRGQFADNREWTRDPSHPAIIIGTVDMIGSRLLFSGYRSSYKQRPLDAGLLGQDSLLVLDEAHLSKPFEKLICGISRFQAGQGSPMRVIRMSATTSAKDENPFKLIDSDLAGNRESNLIVRRFAAEKHLTITPDIEKSKLNDVLCEAAVALAKDNARVVLFVRSPDDATKIAGKIRDHKKAKNQPGPFANAVEVLTGTMRGLERDELLEKPILKRFLDGKETINNRPVLPAILVSTSAGEVGFDLNADHMVCDAAPLDSMIQRLGRVNRRGDGIGETAAQIRVFVAKPDEKKAAGKDEKQNKHTIESACVAATEALGKLPKHTDGAYDASPRAFRNLDKPAEALSPDPTTVELTDILLDAWSMTSITDPMPGRPEVGPWIRGIEDEQSQTTIAWRAELELFKDASNPAKVFKAVFAKHRIRPHETITTNASRVVDFLKGVTTAKKGQHTRPELRDTVVALKFPRNIEMTTIGKLLDNPGILNAEPTLILPPRFGGLDLSGMLSHEAIPPIPKPDDPLPLSLDVADQPDYEPLESARSRLRILIERAGDKWKPIPLPGGRPIPIDLNLDEQYETSTLLFKALAKAALRVRLVQPVAFDEEGDPIRSLVCLIPLQKKSDKIEQKLVEHVGAVECEAKRIADALGLTGTVREGLRFAADWHDEGKKADIWQRFIGRQNDSDEPLGKSAVTRDPKSLRGYRHEFGSLLRLHHPERHKTPSTLPTDMETRDLTLHLIATHHGFGRPHFDSTLVKEFSDEECETLHTDAIRRFARLQRDYGWWHLAWLENLLRCADGAASEAVTGSPDEQEDDTTEDEA